MYLPTIKTEAKTRVIEEWLHKNHCGQKEGVLLV